MSDRVQILGGSAEWADSFVPLEREVIVDESNQELRVGDGVTPGGHRIPNRDSNDERYQQTNAELDAFAGFDLLKRGFLSRVGPASYVFRSISVGEGALEIINPAGYFGNPVITLSANILSDHFFHGDIAFAESIVAMGGLVGNTQGDHLGNVIGDVTGDVTGDLTGDSTGTHTGAQVGDVDVRGHTLQLDDGQIPFSALSGVPAGVTPVPPGGIIMWAGDSTDIPDGWFLCDGGNGTPDLRGQFIVAASENGGASPAHATGGAETHSHVAEVASGGSHDHPITVADHTLLLAEVPSHSHGNGICDTNSRCFNHGSIGASPMSTDNFDSGSGGGSTEGVTTTVGGGGPHSHGATSDAAGNHTHGASTQDSSNIPPFYSLCYIMRGVG
jgi:hypothetical protein